LTIALWKCFPDPFLQTHVRKPNKNKSAKGDKKMDLDVLTVKIKTIISNQLGVDAEAVIPEAHLVDDLGTDSLDVVELVMALEEAFNIEIPDSVAEKIRTVRDIITFFQHKLQLSPQPA
jgi:acyl carrier protein